MGDKVSRGRGFGGRFGFGFEGSVSRAPVIEFQLEDLGQTIRVTGFWVRRCELQDFGLEGFEVRGFGLEGLVWRIGAGGFGLEGWRCREFGFEGLG